MQYDFDPLNDSGGGGTGKTYQVFVLELSGRNVDAVLGSSAVYSGNSLQHRFYFTDGVLINPNVRIGIGLHRTDGGNNEGLSVRFGTESQNSPRESYDDASEDFNFLGRFNHDRPTPSVNDTVGGTTTNQIYGNPEIFYQIIHTHESLVGDGTVSVSHLDSGSAADGTVSTADGSGGVAYEALPVASTTARGIVELATPTEVLSADTTRAATGAGVYSVTGLQVSSVERTAGSETGVRRFSPADVHSMIDTHAPSGGGSDLQVADEGSSLTTAATAINFAGAGVTAAASGTAVTVTIPGGGDSGPLAPAYSATALYELGGSNSLVTFQDQLYFYSSAVSRSSNHSPETHPDYWIDLSTVANYISLNETDSVRIPGGTFVILPDDNSVYLSRDDVDATAERNAAWVRSHAGSGEQFIQVSDAGGGDGEVSLTPRTEAAHNFSFNNTIQSGQERDLFDANITLPTDLDDDAAFVVRVNATHGYAEIVLTKALLEELVAVAPVTWSTSATGTAAVNSGATQNVYFIPLGQNRGAYVGRSTEDPLRLLWAYSHNGAVVIDMQLMTLTAGSGSLPGSEASDNTIASDDRHFRRNSHRSADQRLGIRQLRRYRRAIFG